MSSASSDRTATGLDLWVERSWLLPAALLVCLGIFQSGCRTLATPAGGTKGTAVVKLEERVAGARRSYRLHTPGGVVTAEPRPLVVVLHGAFSSARGIEKHTGFSRLAERENFVVAYPNGIGLLGLLRHWNAEFCCGKAMKSGLDDVGFVLKVIDDVATRTAIDRSQVYLVGNSNGAMLAMLIAATRPETVAAVAVSAGTVGFAELEDGRQNTLPTPRSPVPLLAFHGRDDDTFAFAGSGNEEGTAAGEFLSAVDSAAFWARANGCSGELDRQTAADGELEILRWTGCLADAEVQLYGLGGWGHDWPGPFFLRRGRVGPALRDFDAAELMWDFFRDNALTRGEDRVRTAGEGKAGGP